MSTITARLSRLAEEMRSIALELGPEYAELMHCTGIVNTVRLRIAGSAPAADKIDLKLKRALTEAP